MRRHAPPLPRPPPAPSAPTLPRPRVVIADNDPTIRGVLRSMLARLGLDLVAASDGQGALTAATEDARLFLLDHDMPGGSFSVCRTLRADPPSRTCRSLAEGAILFLTKPFNPAQRLVALAPFLPLDAHGRPELLHLVEIDHGLRLHDAADSRLPASPAGHAASHPLAGDRQWRAMSDHSGPLEPVTLNGRHAALVPLSPDHHDALVEAVRDGELWRLWYTSAPAPAEMRAEIDRRLTLQHQGTMLPFTVLDGPDGRVVGMTTYMAIDRATPRVEIGSTWYARRVQRTALNTEAKRLLLTHAFDRLGCLAVELRTHVLNQQSRRAIERLGARLDGILRAHQRARNGTIRDTCVYSITAPEWPTIQAHLTWLLEKGTSRAE